MDTRTLEAFLTLASTLHFARAAEACHLSPSAFSRQIQQLEQQLGCRLFERDNRRVRLTRAGSQARKYAEEIVQSCGQMVRDLTSPPGVLQGELSLYCSVTASHSLLSGLLSEWRRRQPGVEIKLHTGDEARAIERVLQGSEDAAIAARPRNLPKALRFLQLASTPLVFIAPLVDGPSAPAVNSSFETGSPAWEQLPLILPEAGQARLAVEEWFRQAGKAPSIHAQVTGNEAIVSMVSLGFGVGIVPLLVLRNSTLVDRVRILEVDHPPPAYSVGLCTLTGRRQDPIVEEFWQLAARLRASA